MHEHALTEMEIFSLLSAEVNRARGLFPTWPTRLIDAGGVVGEEAGELDKAILQAVYEPHKANLSDVREEAVQLGAMVIRFLFSLHRYDLTPGEQHNQIGLLE